MCILWTRTRTGLRAHVARNPFATRIACYAPLLVAPRRYARRHAIFPDRGHGYRTRTCRAQISARKSFSNMHARTCRPPTAPVRMHGATRGHGQRHRTRTCRAQISARKRFQQRACACQHSCAQHVRVVCDTGRACVARVRHRFAVCVCVSCHAAINSISTMRAQGADART